MELSNIEWLQQWYQKNCDGEWEHFYGIEIETLDNPGWHVKIDLQETGWAGLQAEELYQDAGEKDWLQCSVVAGVFNGYGDYTKLETILGTFRKWISDDLM